MSMEETDAAMSEAIEDIKIEVTYFTADEMSNLKAQINHAFGELVSILVSIEDRLDALDERIALFNVKSGQKI